MKHYKITTSSPSDIYLIVIADGEDMARAAAVTVLNSNYYIIDIQEVTALVEAVVGA